MCDVIGPSPIGLGQMPAWQGLLILNLPPRRLQWESPSDLCTLGADGHLIFRVDIYIGDNLPGQVGLIGAPQLSSSLFQPSV